MEYAFSILMFCMAAGLLIYAGILRLSRDVTMIPKHYMAKIPDRKAYAVMISKVVSVIALAFLAGGIFGLIWTMESHLWFVSVGLFVAALVGSIVWSVRIVRKSQR